MVQHTDIPLPQSASINLWLLAPTHILDNIAISQTEFVINKDHKYMKTTVEKN